MEVFHHIWFLLTPDHLEVICLVALVEVHQVVQQGEKSPRSYAVGFLVALEEDVKQSVLAQVAMEKTHDLVFGEDWLLVEVVLLEVGDELALVLGVLV